MSNFTKCLQVEALFDKTPLRRGILNRNPFSTFDSHLGSFILTLGYPYDQKSCSAGCFYRPSLGVPFFCALRLFLCFSTFTPFGFCFLSFSFVKNFRRGHLLPTGSFASLNDSGTEGVAPILAKSRMHANTYSEEIYFITHRECVQNSFLKGPRLT